MVLGADFCWVEFLRVLLATKKKYGFSMFVVGTNEIACACVSEHPIFCANRSFVANSAIYPCERWKVDS